MLPSTRPWLDLSSQGYGPDSSFRVFFRDYV